LLKDARSTTKPAPSCRRAGAARRVIAAATRLTDDALLVQAWIAPSRAAGISP